MRFVKLFFAGVLTMTVSTVIAQNEGADGGFEFKEEKLLGAEGASGTEGALSPETLNGSDGIIRASGANNGSEGSSRSDGGTLGSEGIIRSNGTTLGSDNQIFVNPPPLDGAPDIGGGGVDGGGVAPGGGGQVDVGTGGQNTSLAEPEGAVPVDGGLAFLLLAGAGYGSRKAYQMRKKQKQVKSEK
ncbi:MAG: hypothetical protein KGP35_01800 [Bacteroidetes bacterium]|nr:hypothetical protein [Bacteroidota bacterium]